MTSTSRFGFLALAPSCGPVLLALGLGAASPAPAKALASPPARVAPPERETELERQPDVDIVQVAAGGKRTKEVRCLVLNRYRPDDLVVLEEGHVRKYSKRKVAKIERTRREALGVFLSERESGADVAEMWTLVQRAEQLGLHYLARLQAWDLLTRDPEHRQAHEFLGHDRKGDAWRWKHDRKWVDWESFGEAILDWDSRLHLESEHYIVDSGIGLRKTLDTLFDLEWFYFFWMARFAEDIKASEGPIDPTQKMAFEIYASRDDKGFKNVVDSARDPYYDPTGRSRNAGGDRNLVMTYLDPEERRPVQLFDLATQQILYTTLVFGDRRGGPPASLDARFAAWLEFGFGYWMERQIGGEPGYPEPRTFELETSVARLALERLRSGPLSRKFVTEEATNLTHLGFEDFHGNGKHAAHYRAKAQALVAWSMEVRPKIGRRQTASMYYALLAFLQESFGTPKGDSSSALDDCLPGAKIEDATKPWHEWLEGLIG